MDCNSNSNGTPPRRRLSDILLNNGDELRHQWDKTEAADEFAPLPAGTYIARVVSGELFTAEKRKTLGYKLAFRVLEGEHTGRRFWHDLWLTPAALPLSKRDLSKLGVTSVDQLEPPLPAGIRCRVKLALRRGDDDTEYNRVRTFEVVGVDPVADEDFAPADAEAPDSTAATSTEAEAKQTPGEGDVAGSEGGAS